MPVRLLLEMHARPLILMNHRGETAMKIGFHASHEQFTPQAWGSYMIFVQPDMFEPVRPAGVGVRLVPGTAFFPGHARGHTESPDTVHIAAKKPGGVS